MDARDEIKQRLSVEEVVGDYLQLKRSGRNLKALSPFTNEKTPSLMVSPEKQIWHDFSSSKGGDMFTFVMEMEGVDFPGALEILARKANIDLSKYSRGSGISRERKERAIEAHALAIRYYFKTLTKNETALKYLRTKRGFSKEIIGRFELGYAPKSGDALAKFLISRGFSEKEIRDSGLGVSYNNQLRDMFRGRIMVPLKDAQGRPIGFTGRILGEGQPKYLNTPQTVVYDKSNHVFGLSLAKDKIRQEKFVVVTEGNLDVVAAHMAGTENTVAVAGTAMTKRQLLQLGRLTEDVRLAFDNDRAGFDATLRSIPIAQEAGVTLSIINLIGGKDPDEIIKESPAKWKKMISRSQYVVDWLIEQLAKQHDLATAGGKKKFTDSALSLIGRLSDAVERDHYLKEIAKRLDVAFGALEEKLAKVTAQEAPRLKKPKPSDIPPTENTSTYQDLLIGLIMRYPELRDLTKELKPDQFVSAWTRAALKFLDSLERKPLVKTPAELQDHDTYVKIALLRAEELYGSWNSSDLLIEAIGLTRRLHNDYQKQEKSQLSKAIAEAEAKGQGAEKLKLLKEFDHLIRGDVDDSNKKKKSQGEKASS